jgi:hypothetical protein
MNSGSDSTRGLATPAPNQICAHYNLHGVRLPGLKSMQRRAWVEDHAWLIEDHWPLLRMNDLQPALP